MAYRRYITVRTTRTRRCAKAAPAAAFHGDFWRPVVAAISSRAPRVCACVCVRARVCVCARRKGRGCSAVLQRDDGPRVDYYYR